MKINTATPGLEAIDFQRGSTLHADISAVIVELKAARAAVDRDVIGKTLTQVILSKTGMLLDVVFIPGRFNIKVGIHSLASSHPLMKKMELKMLADPLSDYKVVQFDKDIGGTVNLANSTVGGAFSQIPSTLYLPVSIWEDDLLTADEWAAAILHEAGHVFSYYELLGHMFITNYVLNEVVSRWLGDFATERRIDILNGIEKQYDTKITNKSELVENSDPSVVMAIVNASVMNKIRSELGTPYYDARTCEFLADQFAARHGAGRSMVTGMDKIHRASPWLFRSYEFRSTNSMIVANLVQLTIVLTGNTPFSMFMRSLSKGIENVGLKLTGQILTSKPAAAIIHKGIISGAKAIGVTVSGVGLTFLTQLIKENGAGKYDDAASRYAAIKREMLADLKTPGLDKSYIALVLSDIETVEAIVGNLNKVGMLDKMLYQYIVSSFKGDRKEIKLQQQYETLVNNPLFKHAAHLSTLDAL
jgi:hypothetical protein